jgi:hypothetical protein
MDQHRPTLGQEEEIPGEMTPRFEIVGVSSIIGMKGEDVRYLRITYWKMNPTPLDYAAHQS